MDTLMWLFVEFLVPAVMFFYPVCDWTMGWMINMGPVLGMVAVGAVTGVGMNVFLKFCSNQDLLGRCKADLNKIKKATGEAKKAKDEDEQARLMNLSKRISGKYMWASMKPAMITVPPIVVMAMWAGSRMGFMPLRPDEPVKVIAYFEDDAGGYASLLPSEEIESVDAPISAVVIRPETDVEFQDRLHAAEKADYHHWYKPWTYLLTESKEAREKRLATETDKQRDDRRGQVKAATPPRGPEARWLVQPTKAGDHVMKSRYVTPRGQEKIYEVEFPVTEAANGQPPEIMTYYCFDSPATDHIQTLEVKLKDSMPAAWWNIQLQWMGLYLVVALGLGISMRFALKVN